MRTGAGHARRGFGARALHARAGEAPCPGPRERRRVMSDTRAPAPASEARTAPPGVALGLGLTNECNLACAFCYRDPARVDRLTLDQVRAVMARLPVQPVNLTITSNGYSVAVLSDAELRAFHDVEFSLDYPTADEQDAQRGAGNWALIHEQAARCVRAGVPVTIVAVMMKSNYRRLAEVARVAARFRAPLRVNVYQAVRSDAYALTYEEYWDGFRALFAETDVIAIGEPLVRAMAGLPAPAGGCGVSTVRVTPRGTTQPCVYWPGPGEPLREGLRLGRDIVDSVPFSQARTIPDACRPCEFRDSCHGGCAGRRQLH